MTVQNALEEMKERAFAPAFQKYLFDTYKVLAQTDFSEEEKDYTAAEDYFTTTLEQSENEILSQIKTNYEAKLRYASRYAFNAGLYSGFVQHFSNQDLVVDGFEKHLMQDLFEMPGMQRHTLFLKMHDENKKLMRCAMKDIPIWHRMSFSSAAMKNRMMRFWVQQSSTTMLWKLTTVSSLPFSTKRSMAMSFYSRLMPRLPRRISGRKLIEGNCKKLQQLPIFL